MNWLILMVALITMAVLLCGHLVVLFFSIACYRSLVPSYGVANGTHTSGEPFVVLPAREAATANGTRTPAETLDVLPPREASTANGTHTPGETLGASSYGTAGANASIPLAPPHEGGEMWFLGLFDSLAALFATADVRIDGYIVQTLFVCVWDLLFTIGFNNDEKWRLQNKVILKRCLCRTIIPAVGACFLTRATSQWLLCQFVVESVELLRGMRSYLTKCRRVSARLVPIPKAPLVRLTISIAWSVVIALGRSFSSSID
jgi:hypothetical protein